MTDETSGTHRTGGTGDSTGPSLRGQFEVTGWDEHAYYQHGSEKLTRVSAAQRFSGAIDGDGTVEWLMCYRPDGTAHFVGLQRIDGTIDGRSGVVVVSSIGEFDGERAVGDWKVVEGAATGELRGAAGTGRFEAPMGETPTFELELAMPAAEDDRAGRE
jgi:hypothetical protein